MRLGLTFLVLPCSLICVSNGASSVGDISYIKAPYTKEEDQLIVHELTNILDGTIKPHSRSVWDVVARKHYEKWNEGTPGFPQERSAQSLHLRFKHALINKKAQITVPEALIQKFKVEVSRQRYTKEEDNFIIEELLKPTYNRVFSISTYAGLLAELTERREAGIPGFENARTPGSLRNHLMSMKHARQFPERVLRKINTQERGGSSGKSTTSNQQTRQQVPVSNEGQFTDDEIADMVGELLNTDYDIDFSKLD